MQGVSKEWLDFLRNQFPAGSRIQTWELDDPRNTLEEAGTLEHIDDSGRFHVRQSDGGECVLTLGEEMFSVHPPESTQLKLYMPLTASFYARNEWGDWDETGEEWDGRTLLDYEEFLDVKVRSAVFTAEARGGRLWGVAECQVVGQLSPEELTGLKDYLTGQAADGVGEGLEQQAIRVDGWELYVHLWQSEGWSIQTEGERFGPQQVQESPDDGVPTEAQHNRFGGERSSGEMSEPCPQGEAKGMERGMTMGGMRL